MPRTPVPTKEEALKQRQWYLVDAKDLVLGRVASAVASIVRGKHKPNFVPFEDVGDFVVVINAAQIRLTGRKWESKWYIRHTGYPGGVRVRTAAEQKQLDPVVLLRKAITGMLPKNRLGRQLATKVKIYSGADHPHAAQRPQVLDLPDAKRG
jgi:large subunit ribosomal protein L13